MVLDTVPVTVRLPLRDGDTLTLLVTVAVMEFVTLTLPDSVMERLGVTEGV